MDFENYVYKANPTKSKGTVSIQKPNKHKRPKIYDPNDSTISINYLKVQSNVTRDAQEFNSPYHEASFDYLPQSNLYTISKNFSSIPNKSDSSTEISTRNCIIAFIVTFISIAAIVLAVSLPLTLIDRFEPIVKNEDSTKTATETTTTIAASSGQFYQTTTEKTISSTNELKNCLNGFIKTSCEDCGVSFKTPNVKIVGGSIAVEHSWPSMVFILFNYKFLVRSTVLTRKSFCGGTLINRDTILTAAHCFVTEFYYFDLVEKVYTVKVNEFHPTFESMYTVYLGMQNLSGIYDRNQIFGQKFSLKKFLIHPNYNSANFLNDIAIIKLDEEVTLGEKIQFSCLPSSKSTNYPEFSNVDAYAVGWGSTIYEGIESFYLRNVKLTLYEGNLCNNVYVETKKNWTKQICAGEILGGKDTCQGDSGGPLFIKVRQLDGKIKFILVGITSYGENCALAGFPGIYTRVNAFRDWISLIVNQ